MNGILRLGRTVVTAPDGIEWTVGRRWLPRPPRWVGVAFRNLRERDDAPAPRVDGERRDDWWEAVEGLGHLGDAAGTADDLGGCGAIVAVALVVLAAVAVVVFVLPALLLVLDVLFVLVLAGLAVAGRILFRRPWEIVASSGLQRGEWAVVGWAASRRAIRHVAARLAQGAAIGDITPRLG